MGKNILAAFLICVAAACSKQVPLAPGQLGVEIGGLWAAQPTMEPSKQQYPFLIRLTGFVPREAFMVLVSTNYGTQVARAEVQYKDLMQTNPVRNYQFNQEVTHQTCQQLQKLDLNNTPQNAELTIEDVLPTLLPVSYVVEVVDIHRRVLAQDTYTVKIVCSYNQGV